MMIHRIFATALACLAIGPSLAWGQCGTWTTSTIRNCNGIDYELWNQNNVGTVNMVITGGSTNPNGGTFEATWSGTENILFRAGRKWGSSSTTTARSIGNITLDFAATWTSNDNVKMLGVYGWAYYPAANVPTTTESGQSATFSNQIEYYIIQDRGSFNPASGGTNARRYGEATIDGILYEFWVADRINQPMLTGNGNFKQYFSVPRNTSSHRQSGRVNISRHFEEWERVGMRILDCPLYEIAMKVESFTGSSRNSSGSANVTRNLLTLGGSSNPNEFTLQTNVSPVGAGTVTRSPNNQFYTANTSVQLTATPNAGWRFVGWSGDATATTSPTSVSMSSDRSVTARFELVSGDGTVNLIRDGNFPSASVISNEEGTSWRLAQGQYWGNSAATSSVTGGTAAINVTTLGAETYQPQLVQYNVPLDQGMRYKLTFRARAATARSIEASFQQAADPWAGYASRTFDLTTTDQDFEFVFAMTSATDPAAQFAFNLGQATGNVWISDVRLVHTTDATSSISRGRVAQPGRLSMVTLNGATLHVTPFDGSPLEIQVVDANGTVRAGFQAASAAAFSLSHLPAGLYFLNVIGAASRESTPIVLE